MPQCKKCPDTTGLIEERLKMRVKVEDLKEPVILQYLLGIRHNEIRLVVGPVTKNNYSVMGDTKQVIVEQSDVQTLLSKTLHSQPIYKLIGTYVKPVGVVAKKVSKKSQKIGATDESPQVVENEPNADSANSN